MRSRRLSFLVVRFDAVTLARVDSAPLLEHIRRIGVKIPG
jgi:hypothetical protein